MVIKLVHFEIGDGECESLNKRYPWTFCELQNMIPFINSTREK